MSKTLITSVVVIVVLVGGFYALNNYIYSEKQADTAIPHGAEVEVTPISHATLVLGWGDKVIYTDPTGGVEIFAGQPEPDLILITDVHGDHFDLETLQAVSKDKTTIVAPQVVVEQLPDNLPGTVVTLANGEVTNQQGFGIQGIAMYNLPESPDSFHVKGRGNGYVVEAGGKRVYIAGDTADTPEMRALQDIDIAFVPMNLPYTMSVESAADGALAFAPRQVYPYHYRGPEGLSDINRFKEIINSANPDIEVVLLDWYQQ